MNRASSHGLNPAAHALFAGPWLVVETSSCLHSHITVDMLWCPNPATKLQRARVLIDPDHGTVPDDLPDLILHAPALKMDQATMVSFILFLLGGGRGAGPHLAVVMGHPLDTTVRTQTLLCQVGEATRGIICLVVGMKILIDL